MNRLVGGPLLVVAGFQVHVKIASPVVTRGTWLLQRESNKRKI